MAAEPIVRLSAKEDVFQANHRKHVRFAIAMAVVAAAGTALAFSPPFLRDPESPPLGLEYVLFVAIFLVGLWSLPATAYRVAKRDLRFYADGEEFQPNRLDAPHRSRLAAF